MSGKAHYEQLKEQKQEMEMEYEERVKKIEEEHNLRIAEMESAHNHKVRSFLSSNPISPACMITTGLPASSTPTPLVFS